MEEDFIKQGQFKTSEGARVVISLYSTRLEIFFLQERTENSNVSKLVEQRSHNLLDITVQSDDKDENCFIISEGKVCTKVVANSSQERDKWLTTIRKVIELYPSVMDEKRKPTILIENASESEDECCVCEKNFVALEKRYVCYRCTKTVCDNCVTKKVVRSSAREETARICENCLDEKTFPARLNWSKLGFKHKRNSSLSEGQCEEIVKKKGYLKKQSGVIWKSRWFVLRKSTLTYYQNEDTESKPLNIIFLSSKTKIHESLKKPEGFQISMNDKCIELIAETVAEKNEWFAALKKCLVGEVQRSNSDFPHRNGSSDQVSLTDRRSKDSSDTISVDIPLIPSPLKATYHRRTMSDDGKLKYSSGSSDVPSCTELNSSGDDDIDEDELFPEDDFSARVRPGTPPYEMNDFTWQAKRANQFAKDWALIEEWAQDLSTNVKIGNENLKGEVKKALIRLKKESQKPFIIIGNDLKKFNDKLINRQKGKAKGDIFMDLSETQDSISIPNTPRNEEVLPEGVTFPLSEVLCGCMDHGEMIMMLEENISLRVDHLFRALYSSSSVFKSNYYNHKGIKDVEEIIHETHQYQDSEWWKKRTVRYLMPIKNPIAKSPFTLTIENQSVTVIEEMNRYIVDIVISNPEVIYGDTFDVHARYCLTYVSPTTSKLFCHARMIWKKSTVLKPMITKLGIGAMKETLKDEFSLLHLDRSNENEAESPSQNVKVNDDKPCAKANFKRENSVRSLRKVVDMDQTSDNNLQPLSLKTMLLISGALIISILLLSPLVSKVLSVIPDPTERLIYGIRSAAYTTLPLPFALIFERKSPNIGNFMSLVFFFFLNIIALTSFKEMESHMSIVFLFSAYHFIGTTTFLIWDVIHGNQGFKNPGLTLCFSTGILMLFANLFLSIYGSD